MATASTYILDCPICIPPLRIPKIAVVTEPTVNLRTAKYRNPANNDYYKPVAIEKAFEVAFIGNTL